MPRFDGTGPWGLGPGTGWGLGPCCLRLRRGVGARYGFKNWTKQDKKAALEEEIGALKEELKVAEEELKLLRDQK